MLIRFPYYTYFVSLLSGIVVGTATNHYICHGELGLFSKAFTFVCIALIYLCWDFKNFSASFPAFCVTSSFAGVICGYGVILVHKI